MAEKAVYSLTEDGDKEFENLMLTIADQPVHIFLDFNAVIVNLDSLAPDVRRECVDRIEKNVQVLKSYIQENIHAKADLPEIPETGKAVLNQQLILAEAIEKWIASVRDALPL